jgi:hypothetical protein
MEKESLDDVVKNFAVPKSINILEIENREGNPSIDTLFEFIEDIQRLGKVKKELMELGNKNPNQKQSLRTFEIARKYMPILEKEIDKVLDFYDFVEQVE